MGKFYLAHISYNGEAYYGWQRQKNDPSVQEEIAKAIRSVYEFGRIDVKATSRTDRGVHAFSQVVKMLIPRRVDAPEMQDILNEALPQDIYIHQLERINKSFKVTHLSLYKEYLYFFTLGEKVPFSFVGHFEGEREASLSLMRQGASLFEGEHSFARFQYRSEVKGGMERKIYFSRLLRAHEIFPQCFSEDSPVFCFHVRGSGFLKQMVRIMVGSLFKVAVGDLKLSELREELKEGGELSRKPPGFIAPSNALFLYHVQYPPLMIGDKRREVKDAAQFKTRFQKLELWNKQRNPTSFPLRVLCD